MLGYRKKIVRRNIDIILPQASQQEKILLEREYYRHLAEMFLETIWCYTAKPEEIYPKVKFLNLEKFEEIYQKGKHATILISHIGNWELFCQWAPLFIPKLDVIVLYTPIKNETLNTLMLKVRERYGARLVSTKSTLELYRIQKSKDIGINLFAIDQNPGDPYHQYWMDFFDTKVPVISGAEKFAISQKQDAYFLWVEKRNGIYELELKRMDYDPNIPYDLTHQQVHLLEENIQLNPALWLLSHNRFKHAEGN